MDVFSKGKRSQIMSRISGKDTKPEILVRSLLHRMGFRFRLHTKDLPGKPDITLPKHKRVIFVHGCFWHGHKDCTRSKRPSTNVEFWNKKFEKSFKN
jgi:DNA mismatch endonuclease, patch repair protein